MLLPSLVVQSRELCLGVREGHVPWAAPAGMEQAAWLGVQPSLLSLFGGLCCCHEVCQAAVHRARMCKVVRGRVCRGAFAKSL